jgi:hypothetical protein
MTDTRNLDGEDLLEVWGRLIAAGPVNEAIATAHKKAADARDLYEVAKTESDEPGIEAAERAYEAALDAFARSVKDADSI